MVTVGIDVGGTFTDFVVVDGTTIRTHKVLSSRRDPAGAVVQGLADLGLRSPNIVHGCTLATNAFLERRGAKVALLTTAGFEDLLEIGRQNRGKLYDLEWNKPAPLVPASRRIGIQERIAADGTVVTALKIPRFDLKNVEAVAICFLHSYLNPAHERAIAKRIKVPVSVSSELLPEYREYERLATTVLNAYVMPVMDRYLKDLRKRTRGTLSIMVSSGGQMTARAAARKPVHTLLSGPAGGAIAVEHVCREARIPKAIAFDVGGTSTDVSLYDGGIDITKEGTLGDFPIRIPILDIHTVGAGGGSIARIDSGGALRVGPESAGSEPGPACYGRGGTEPTVTDAQVVLERISPNLFFGGRLELDTTAAFDSIARIAKKLGRSVHETAGAILDVTGSNLERAVRTVSVERGHEPEDFALIPFGGAGGLHACDLAARLGMKRVVVPRWPGLLSALGMTLADGIDERSKSVLCGIDDPAVERAFRSLGSGERFVDLRFHGQSYELRTPWGPGMVRRFTGLHRRRYGYARSVGIEVVNAIVRHRVKTAKPRFPKLARGNRKWPTGIIVRDHLKAGDRIQGPSTIMEHSATTYVMKGWAGTVDGHGNIDLVVRHGSPQGPR